MRFHSPRKPSVCVLVLSNDELCCLRGEREADTVIIGIGRNDCQLLVVSEGVLLRVGSVVADCLGEVCFIRLSAVTHFAEHPVVVASIAIPAVS